MEMKKIVSALVLTATVITSNTSYAGLWGATAHSRANCLTFNEYDLFIKDGLPIPGSGVQVLPLSQIKLLNTPEQRARIKSFLSKGYVEEYNNNALELLTIKSAAEEDLNKSATNLNPASTHMHKNLSDLKMAYNYTGVPQNLLQSIIGFAALGAFLPEKGWTGAVEFFEPIDLVSGSMCSYRESNIQLTGGAVILAKELVTYSVNDKASIINISGNKSSGYAYDIEWYDDNYRKILTCAVPNYDPSLKDKIINLAQLIDKSK